MTKKTGNNNQSSFEPRKFSQIFLSAALISGIIIIPILLIGVLILSISRIGPDPILWSGCLSIPLIVGLVFTVILTLLNKEVYQVLPYSKFNATQEVFRNRFVDEKIIINLKHYRIVYSNDNEFHFKFRMSPKLRIRLLEDRAEVVGVPGVINELIHLLEKLPKSYTKPETYIHSPKSGSCYFCRASYQSGQGYMVPITVAFTVAFRYLAESTSENKSVDFRRSLLLSVRQTSSPAGNMETPTPVCPECARILA